MTYAKIIADSCSGEHRVTTMEVEFHRFVLAEFNTHRMFSRNSASSRAIPVSKQIERIEQELAVPLTWPAEQKGMQGGTDLPEQNANEALGKWQSAALSAILHAKQLVRLGVHKSVTNRLLEPFMFHTVVVTGTEYAYENFFAQRCSPLAQPEIRAAAELMKEEYDLSTPVDLTPGQWHLPYIDKSDWLDAIDHLPQITSTVWGDVQRKLIRVSAARCARVSYLTQDGRRDQAEDLSLYERLVSADPPHWSPLEHPCRPDWNNREKTFGEGMARKVQKRYRPSYGNLTGFLSLRSILELELEK